jgi:hypothetical protein
VEGCRDLDTLELAEGKEATLAEIQQLAQETVFRVQTRSQSKVTQSDADQVEAQGPLTNLEAKTLQAPPF